jgi:transcriptional regulator with XRE-family HTH domain
MTGGVYVDVPRLRLEIALRGWRPTDLARAARLSAGTITTVMRGRPVSPATLRKIATALRQHHPIPGLDELLAEGGVAASP